MIKRSRGWWIAIAIAALSLGCHADKDDPEGLAKELSDPVRRENAIYNLKQIYGTALATHAGDRTDPEVVAVADVIVEPLTQAYLNHPEDRINGLAILELLHETQDPRAVPALVEALKWRTEVSEDHAIRAAQALQATNLPDADKAKVIEALGSALDRITDSRPVDNKMRIAMIGALGSTGDRQATEILTRIAIKQDEKQNFLINRLAAQQLGELRDPTAIPALIQSLFMFAPNRPDLRMNDVAAEALIRIGRPSLEPLLKLMKGDDETANEIAKHYIETVKARRPDLATSMTVRQVTGSEATFALGALGFDEALDALLAEASSSDTTRKLNGAIALVRLKVPEGREDRVRAALKSAYASLPKGYEGLRMRGQLLAAMAHTYDASLMPFILDELADSRANPELRLIAAQNYALLANAAEASRMQAVVAKEDSSSAGGYREKFEEHEPLLKIAEECDQSVDCWVKKLSDTDAKIARKAAYMIGRYGEGNKPAIVALVGQLGNEDLGVRLGALMALDQIAVEGSPDAVTKIDDLRKREEGQSVWTQFRGEALPIQARLRSRSES